MSAADGDEGALLALQRLRRALSVEQNPPIDEAIEAGSVPIVCELAKRDDNSVLQFEALWALTNIASGNAEQTAVVVDAGAVPIAVNCLGMPADDVKEQATWLLGNIAGDSMQMRDLVLRTGAVEPLIVNVANPRLSLARNTAWTISNLCRGKPVPPFDHVGKFLPVLTRCLSSEDGEIIADTCWAISYLTDGPNECIEAFVQTGGVRRVVELLQHPLVTVQTPALRAVGNIVTGDDRQTQMALDAGTVPALLGLLGSQRRSIRKEACWTISNISAGSSEQIQHLIDANVFPMVLELLSRDESQVRKEALWAVANATTGGKPEQIAYLVHLNSIQAIVQCIGAMEDGRTVRVGLEAVDNILNVGARKQAEEGGDANPYANILEEVGGLDVIEGLQEHAQHEVYEIAMRILQNHFEAVEEEEAEVEADPNNAFQFMPAAQAPQQQRTQLTSSPDTASGDDEDELDG